MTTKEECFFYHMEVAVVDGKCTENCIMEDCAIVDEERLMKQPTQHEESKDDT